MKYLIIGNGAAGIAAAEKIRRLDEKSGITILSAEKYAAYSKCLLPDFLSGEITEDRMFIRDKDFYEKKNIKIYYNHKVIGIDFKLRHVITANSNNFSESGSIFTYDKLLIATGSTQVLPPIKGLNHSNYHLLGTLVDAKRIMEDSKDARKIIIIGAGFVGLETAFNLYKKGKEITVIEKTPRVLQNQLDERASGIIQNSLEEEGIRLILNCSVSEISGKVYSNIARRLTGTRTKTVVLEDGRRLKADMIIISTGSKPNLDFIRNSGRGNSGLEINRGILVDQHMQTSFMDVYAAGDVVETIDAVTGENSLSPIWPNAVIQGEIAGSNMAGKILEFSSLISMQNASEFREIPMISMGITAPSPAPASSATATAPSPAPDGSAMATALAPAPDGSESEYEEYIDYRPTETVYRKLVIKDNVIVGMIFGDIKNAGVIGALMKQRINVGNIKNNLLNPNFGYSEISYALPEI